MANFVHIDQVLTRQPCHGNVQDVEVLLANQVQQQIQRAFKGLQKNLQRIRRDVQILRHGKQRLAVESRHGDLVHHHGHVGQNLALASVQGGCVNH